MSMPLFIYLCLYVYVDLKVTGVDDDDACSKSKKQDDLSSALIKEGGFDFPTKIGFSLSIGIGIGSIRSLAFTRLFVLVFRPCYSLHLH